MKRCSARGMSSYWNKDSRNRRTLPVMPHFLVILPFLVWHSTPAKWNGEVVIQALRNRWISSIYQNRYSNNLLVMRRRVDEVLGCSRGEKWLPSIRTFFYDFLFLFAFDFDQRYSREIVRVLLHKNFIQFRGSTSRTLGRARATSFWFVSQDRRNNLLDIVIASFKGRSKWSGINKRVIW